MIKNKKFDCVKMKQEIQEQILKEAGQMSKEEFKKISNEKLLADPILGPLWARRQEKRNH